MGRRDQLESNGQNRSLQLRLSIAPRGVMQEVLARIEQAVLTGEPEAALTEISNIRTELHIDR